MKNTKICIVIWASYHWDPHYCFFHLAQTLMLKISALVLVDQKR